MPQFATLLFDLDGTLVDAFTTIHRAFAHTLPQFGRPAPSMAEVRNVVGGGLAQAMGRFLPPERLDDAMKVHRAHTEEILLEDVRLFPGGAELLRAQHALGTKLAVYTNKHGNFARSICTHLGVAGYLDGIYGADDTPWLKPQREFTEHVLRDLGANAASTLLIGDSPFDVETARLGGISCWCVTTGTHDEEQLRAAGAARTFADLPALARALAT